MTPTRGTALETPFELAARNWVDAEGHYPLRYRFSLGAEGLALQSASTRASYNGVLSLPTGGASAASVPVTCTVEDSLGATTTVTQAVRIEPPALALSDPASFLADQTAAAQKLLAQKDGAVPGSATLVRALLLLLQCADVLNDPRVTRSMDAQVRVRLLRVDGCVPVVLYHTLPSFTYTRIHTHLGRRHSGGPSLNARSRPPSASSSGLRAAAAVNSTPPLSPTLC